MKLEKWLPYIIGGVVLYFVWGKARQTVDKAVNTALGPIIDAVVGSRTPSVNATFVLPDGTRLDADTVAKHGTTFFSGNAMYLDYGGRRYKVVARDSSGNYPLVAV